MKTVYFLFASFIGLAAPSKVIELDLQKRSVIADHSRRLTIEPEYEQDVRNYINYEYFTTVNVGSHRQAMSLIIDTGSSWTWLVGEDCPNPQQCSGTPYKSGMSQTFFETEKQYDITYKKGYVEG